MATCAGPGGCGAMIVLRLFRRRTGPKPGFAQGVTHGEPAPHRRTVELPLAGHAAQLSSTRRRRRVVIPARPGAVGGPRATRRTTSSVSPMRRTPDRSSSNTTDTEWLPRSRTSTRVAVSRGAEHRERPAVAPFEPTRSASRYRTASPAGLPGQVREAGGPMKRSATSSRLRASSRISPPTNPARATSTPAMTRIAIVNPIMTR